MKYKLSCYDKETGLHIYTKMCDSQAEAIGLMKKSLLIDQTMAWEQMYKYMISITNSKNISK